MRFRHFLAVMVTTAIAITPSWAAQGVAHLASFGHVARGRLDPRGPSVPAVTSPVAFRTFDNTGELLAGIDQTNAVRVYRRFSDHYELQAQYPPLEPNMVLAAGEFDGQPGTDLLALRSRGSIHLLLNDGRDGFVITRNGYPLASPLDRLCAYTGVVGRPQSVLVWGVGTRQVLWIGRVTDPSTPPVVWTLPNPANTLGAADLDGDGQFEIIIGSAKDVDVLAGPPANLTTYNIPVGISVSSITVVDSSVDPALDLLITSTSDGSVSLFYQNDANHFVFREAPQSPLYVGTWPTDATRVAQTTEYLLSQADGATPLSIQIDPNDNTLGFSSNPPYEPGVVIANVRPHVTRSEAQLELNTVAALCGQGPITLRALFTPMAMAVISTEADAEGCTITQLRRSSRVFAFVEPDWRFTTNLELASTVPDWVADDLDLASAHNLTRGEAKVAVAVLDSGGPTTGRVRCNRAEVTDGIDNDQNGFVDDVCGVDIVNGAWGQGASIDTFVSGSSQFVDSVTSKHGTVVMGTLLGVAPQVSVMPIKVLDVESQTTASKLALGVYYAAQGAMVANLSIAGPNDSQVLRQAIARATTRGVVIVGATGNDGDGGSVAYPALYNDVIAVGAHSRPVAGLEPALWQYSNHGAGSELTAPGDEVCVTLPTGTTCHTGTSISAPLVAGTLALMRSLRFDLDLCVSREILRATAVDLGDPGYDLTRGFGKVATGAAVALTPGYVSTQCTLSNDDPIRWRVAKRDFVTPVAEQTRLGGVTKVLVLLDTSFRAEPGP